ncbi:aldolase/citrate lyase family protein [Leptospira noguchii]|uniref:HpcH/HpaI aldolase family protein n=1 Tax=Leptospira noguchii TaxID=28182 RepID=UPI001F0663BC|nr:aldolase/citrate lyase family protein [Leptospira noguchii]MCH1913307.1 aldolase/citrate lyase family protein [Leptospira noguchii]MCH1915429.1 aldolase/citrate lyase family protein [Leptospira noguchii]UOG65278.1 aldolase/citrate lyase family protein [Leptospira noguchii]
MIPKKRKEIKNKLKNRERLFGGWVSYAHPSITETFAKAGFDFIAIDMEHSTISLEQAQRIIAASQSEGCVCLPRPVSHSNDWTKPLLDSGADGMLYPMVQTKEEVRFLADINKYPSMGRRSFGVNRAQEYGFVFDEYVKEWNGSSILMLQIESIQAVENIETLLAFEEVDGVMIGPYDMSGSLGVPGQTTHPSVLEASKKVILACEKYGKSCGSQIADVTEDALKKHFDQGYTYSILGSDLFVLWKWAELMRTMMSSFKS